jgi:hypothetical protein
LRKSKAQVAAFLIVIIAVLFVAILATMFIGEMAWQRVRLTNITDSALISASADYSRKLNQIRQIHFQMLLNYVRTQTALLARLPWPTKFSAYAAAMYLGGEGILTSRDLYNSAKRLADDAGKGLRIALYDRIFGGALIDEPKPFIDLPDAKNAEGSPVFKPCTQAQIEGGNCDEVLHEDGAPSKKIIAFNYNAYLKRSDHLTQELRHFKKDHSDTWYDQNQLSYGWNKSKGSWDAAIGDFRIIPGKLYTGEEQPGEEYASYLQVRLEGVPGEGEVKIEPYRMILFFLYACGHSICPGFIPHPYAWIKSIDAPGDFGVSVKKLPFRHLSVFYPATPKEEPFTEKEKKEAPGLEYSGWVHISGGIWSGYEPKLAATKFKKKE